jgi:hypothetical protein
MTTLRKPFYKRDPIGSVDALGRVLGISACDLTALAAEAESLYRSGKKVDKADGSFRETIDALPRLKKVQKRIQVCILNQVSFPNYLQGSIRDKQNRRDHIANATIHAGAKIVFNEDISKFFPSTQLKFVRAVWQHFFNFPPDVAEILTILTTKDEILPQGTHTSPLISNLIFWDVEPEIEEKLRARGFNYSRYIDDVTVSSKHPVRGSEKGFVVQSIVRMMARKGLRPKRSKHRIFTSGAQMLVNNQIVNGAKPSMPQKKRSAIRAAVKECETAASTGRRGESYRKLFDSVSGRVAEYERMHPGPGASLRERLNLIPPIKPHRFNSVAYSHF